MIRITSLFTTQFMKNPKITIIMPTFNRREFILDAVNAILSQDYDNFELIIKDGGDSIFDILPKDERIIYIHGKDRGITDAVNTALRISTGHILNWSNDDDMMSPGTLKFTAENMGEHRWCYGRILMIDGQREILHGREYDFNLHLKGNFVPQPSVFWTREAMDQIGLMNEENDLCSDYEYWLRLGSKFEPKFFDRVMARYRIHPGQLTLQKTGEQLRQAILTAKKYENFNNR